MAWLLAARGTVFTKSYCQWPVCGPTRASLMTSLRPEAVGVTDLKTNLRAKNPDVLTLPQHFLANGYVTVGCGKIYDPRCVDNEKDCDKPSWSLPFVVPRLEEAEPASGENGEGAPVVICAMGAQVAVMDSRSLADRPRALILAGVQFDAFDSPDAILRARLRKGTIPMVVVSVHP